MEEKFSPLTVLISCFTISSVAGLAALLRSNKSIDIRSLISASLYSGLLGLVIGLVWYNYFAPANLYFLIGISGLAGLGGVSLVDVIVQILLRGGIIKINVEPDDKEDK